MDNYPVDALADRYCFYRGKYVMMRGEGVYHKKSRYTRKQIWEHFKGLISLCIFSGPANTSFISIDIDFRDPDVVHKVVDTMADLGFPREKIYVSDSGGKGYHVDVFYDGSIRNWMNRQVYDLIIYFSGLDPHKVEFRPTHEQSIKLPLGVHQKTGRRCWFVDRDTLEPIEDFGYIETTEKVPLRQVEEIIKAGNKRRFYELLEEARAAAPPAGCANRGGCAAASPIMITEPGTRHKRTIEEALRLYRMGGDYNSIHDGLMKWMERQDRSLYEASYEEYRRDIDYITGWVMQAGRRRETGGNTTTHKHHSAARIYQSDVSRIIKAPTKAARMLAFFITIICDKIGVCSMGADKLGEHVGIKSNKTIVEASKAFAELGIFNKSNGGYVYSKNHIHLISNKFRFPDGYERGGEYVEVNEMVGEDNIYRLYIDTLARIGDMTEMAAALSKPELKDIKEWCEGVGQGEADDDGWDGGGVSCIY